MHRILITLLLILSYLEANDRPVLSVGEPMIDLIYHVEEELLASLKIEKGGSLKQDYPSFLALQALLAPREPKMIPGGSSANTLKGLARLGHRCRYMGKIGSDALGQLFLSSLHHYQISPHLLTSPTHTTQVLSLVTPDGHRTMRCCFGASNELMEGELTIADFEGVQHVHIEGYMLYYEKVILRILQLAKLVGAKVSLDLASFEVVNRFRATLPHLLQTYVDIVFANEDEAKALTGLNPQDACWELQTICPIAVVLVGENGCWVGSKGTVFQAHTPEVEVIDTTGAGDLFASGFLHGYLSGYPLEVCAHFGNLTGSTSVTVDGAEIPDEKWESLRRLLLPLKI